MLLFIFLGMQFNIFRSGEKGEPESEVSLNGDQISGENFFTEIEARFFANSFERLLLCFPIF